MKNILIVENDLGFLFWLGAALVGGDYQPWPACGVSEAKALLDQIRIPIDLLIVDSSLPGVSKLITLLRRSQARLKVIAVGAEGGIELPGVNAWRQKPETGEESAKQEWLEAVRNIVIGRKRAA
jgi:DNA-binding NtrC family response regulator